MELHTTYRWNVNKMEAGSTCSFMAQQTIKQQMETIIHKHKHLLSQKISVSVAVSNKPWYFKK